MLFTAGIIPCWFEDPSLVRLLSPLLVIVNCTGAEFVTETPYALFDILELKVPVGWVPVAADFCSARSETVASIELDPTSCAMLGLTEWSKFGFTDTIAVLLKFASDRDEIKLSIAYDKLEFKSLEPIRDSALKSEYVVLDGLDWIWDSCAISPMSSLPPISASAE